mgnify:CR=1 FL=1
MLRIGLGQIEITPGNPRKNKEAILQAMAYGKALRLHILVFPELSLSGYLIGDLWDQPAFVDECVRCGEEIIAATDEMAVIFGNVGVDTDRIGYDGRRRKMNALFAAQHGKALSAEESPYDFTVKTLNPNYRFFDEDRYFISLPVLAQELNGRADDLLGPITFNFKDLGDITVAPLICEDSWEDNYSLSPADCIRRTADRQGQHIDAYINISASPFTLGKNERRHRQFGAKAKELQTPMVYVNAVSLQNNGKSICTFDGQSTVYNPDGTVAMSIPAYEATVRPVQLKKEGGAPYAIAPDDQEPPAVKSETEQIFHALSFGLNRFLRQCHLDKVVIGVSGGIDSAVNAALYAHILGPRNVYLVNMPSRFNSDQTKDLAAQLAKNLGCPYTICPIEDSINLTVDQFEHTVFTVGDEKIEPTVSSFVKENIQARDRSARVLAGLAASLGAAFTCNGNKTEFSVGYATLYGDLAGFLAATGDLWKYQVYDLARYLNDVVYDREVIPMGTIDIVPSAELSADQDITKGQGDPLQYEYHDRLFRSFTEAWNRQTPEDILRAYRDGILEELLGLPHPITHFFSDAETFVADLERWWRLYSGMAIAKRIQAPPILVVSRRAYGGDLHESQVPPYYTDAYYELKDELLKQ